MLAVGGTDPLVGAGVFADVAQIAAAGLHPLAVVTGIVDQDSAGVRGFSPVNAAWVHRSVQRAVDDGRPDVVRVGMLASGRVGAAVRAALAPWWAHRTGWQLVLDPVLSGGTTDSPSLSRTGLVRELRRWLGPGVLVTPNGPELRALSGVSEAISPEALVAAARRMAEATGAAILVKSGHTATPGQDVLVLPSHTETLVAHPRWSPNVHGTGCFLATAIACELAAGIPLTDAVERGRAALAHAVAKGLVHVGAGRPQLSR